MFGCADPTDEATRKALRILKIIFSIMTKNLFATIS